jgi:hypothetical protein
MRKKIIKNPFGQEELLLNGKFNLLDKRYLSFLSCFTLMKNRKIKVIVETGTARGGKSNFKGDGGSTILFGEWIKRHGGELYSVDIDKKNLLRASKSLKDTTKRVYFVLSDSIKFLKKFNKTIDFLYLDSFDYDHQNPIPSQQHHLNEIKAAYHLLSKNSIVMIDDCKLKNGGKGKFVIKYLLKKGWKILVDSYQVILINEIEKNTIASLDDALATYMKKILIEKTS